MKTRLGFVVLVAVLTIGAMSAYAQTSAVDPRAEQLWQHAHQRTFSKAFPLLLEAAKLGHPKAESALGNIYWQGMHDVPQNYTLAAYWLQKAAAQGNRASQFKLAGMYTEGLGGLPVDLRKAAELLTASAHQGYAPAQSALGTCYEFAEGVPRDRQAATYWLDQAATQGDQTAAIMARVLKDPHTAQFATEAQFASYIIAQQQADSSTNGQSGYRCVPNLAWSGAGGAASGPPVICR